MAYRINANCIKVGTYSFFREINCCCCFSLKFFFRYISYVLPQTFACEAMRGILLRGWGITYMPGKNISLLDNAPNYLLSWVRHPKETKVATFLYKNSYMSLVFTYVVVIIGKLWMNYNLDYGQRDQILETSMT